MWNYISEHRPLPEEHVIFFYRQTISAVAYCHDFNICHRDLKPENILLTIQGQIKICDFGMAALHQTEDHHLSTFCGSINYAAPEVLNHTSYRGDRADVWSLGVILYIMLTASLPFEGPDRRETAARASRAQYAWPHGEVSADARDLVDAILVVNPATRMSIARMWRHALMVRYDYLDNLGGFNLGQPAGLQRRSELRSVPVPPGTTDAQLLRQLRSLFHSFSDEELESRLASTRPNDHKVFYWLLQRYREKQLENFSPDIAHSVSDYHHLKPGSWRQRVSTRSFVTGSDGQGVSRFTVYSNVAEEENETGNGNANTNANAKIGSHEKGKENKNSTQIEHNLTRVPSATKSVATTVQSYDPYRASRTPVAPNPLQDTAAKFVIHGRRQEAEYVAHVAQARRGGYTGGSVTSHSRYGADTISTGAPSTHMAVCIATRRTKLTRHSIRALSLDPLTTLLRRQRL